MQVVPAATDKKDIEEEILANDLCRGDSQDMPSTLLRERQWINQRAPEYHSLSDDDDFGEWSVPSTATIRTGAQQTALLCRRVEIHSMVSQE